MVSVNLVANTDLQTAEEEVPFALTSEAGLNDALAFPFVYFAILMALLVVRPRGLFGYDV